MPRTVTCHRAVVGLLSCVLVGAPQSQAAGQDLAETFLTMDGQRAFSVTGVAETSSRFERPRLGLGGEFKLFLSPTWATSLRAHALWPPSSDGEVATNVDLGVEAFIVQTGPVALALEAYGGATDVFGEQEGAKSLECGLGAGLYVALNKNLAVGFAAARAWVEDAAPRWAFMGRIMAF